MWPVVYPEPYLLVDASSEVPGRAVPQGSQTHLGHLLFGQEAGRPCGTFLREDSGSLSRQFCVRAPVSLPWTSGHVWRDLWVSHGCIGVLLCSTPCSAWDGPAAHSLLQPYLSWCQAGLGCTQGPAAHPPCRLWSSATQSGLGQAHSPAEPRPGQPARRPPSERLVREVQGTGSGRRSGVGRGIRRRRHALCSGSFAAEGEERTRGEPLPRSSHVGGSGPPGRPHGGGCLHPHLRPFTPRGVQQALGKVAFCDARTARQTDSVGLDDGKRRHEASVSANLVFVLSAKSVGFGGTRGSGT